MLPLLALALATGIGLAEVARPPPWSAWLVAGAALALGGRSARQPRRRVAAALLLSLATGLYAQGRRLWEARSAAATPACEAVLEAVVAETSSPLAPRWVTLERVRGVDARLPARLRLYAAAPEELAGWLPGDRVRVQARVRPLQPARNPGSPDSGRRLERRGLGAVASLRHPSLQVRLAEAPAPRRRLHELRRRVARGLDAAGQGAGLLRALSLGDRSRLAPQDRDAFVRLGLGHSLAVSGMHLAWVAAALYEIARRLLARSATLAARFDTRRVALGVAAVGALAYAALAGWGVPVRRALVLLAAAGWAIARSRPQAVAPPLSAAALWILGSQPHALFEAGPQLSFAAVGALVAFCRRSRAGSERGWRASLRRSATAILATAPLLAAHGLGVAPAALVANAVALPWLGCVVLPVSLAAASAVAFHLPAMDWIVNESGRIAELTLAALRVAAVHAPATSRGVPTLGAWLGACGVALAGLLCRRLALRAAAAVAVALTLASAGVAPFAPAPPRLVALDVGQGAATLVQGRRAAVLIDGGGRHPDGWDAGRARVVPALRALGVRRLDLLVVTHGDVDHRGGAPAVLESIPVGEVWLPRGARGDPAFDALRTAARRAGVAVHERGRGSAVRRLGDLRVDPLWPPRDARAGARNAHSLAVAIEVGGRRVLVPGDLDARAEAALLARRAHLAADVLLLPHHGSRSSSSRGFLARVDPSLVVASAPCRGRFHMPQPEVRARVAERGAPLWWTGRDGAVAVHLGATLWASSVGAPRADCN